MAGQPVDLSDFFHAVIAHLVTAPNGATFICKLGLDPGVKQTWNVLNLPKSKKMTNILDTRPDLFSRFMTGKGQPMVKLEPLGFDCVPPKPIPPPDPSFAGSSPAAIMSAPAAPTICAAPATAVGLPPPGVSLNPQEARKCFMRNVLIGLRNVPGNMLDLSQVGSFPEVQQAWKAGGLDKRFKMVDIMKERPDIISVHVNERGCVILGLTVIGLEFSMIEDVPDPDPSICPPQAQPKVNTYMLNKGKGKGKGAPGGQSLGADRFSPFPIAAPVGQVSSYEALMAQYAAQCAAVYGPMTGI